MFKALFAVLALGAFVNVHAATLTDKEIAKILLTVNQGEIDAAQLAKKQARTSEVKDFANMMIDVHQQNITETTKVADANSITPTDSAMSDSLKNEAEKSNKQLKTISRPKMFDQAYMAEQVKMHEKALATLKNDLIPNAQNAELKAHLEKTQVAVTDHLQHARMLQTKIQ